MELVQTGRPGEALPSTASGPRSLSWWGMVLFVATEATMFALLIAAFWYLRFRAGPQWPPGGIEKPALTLPLVMTAILWSSTIPVIVAERGIRRGNRAALGGGLLVAFALGAAFLAVQIFVEYPASLRDHPPSQGAYGSLFFALTGLHGLHVAVGLALSGWVQVRAWRGAFSEHRHVSVQNFALYWHFVDVVWLFVLVTVYLSPHVP